MFNSISGEITYKDEERVFILAHSIEWDFTISRKSSEKLPPVGQPARIFTYLVHREDLMKLYGFADAAERALFLDLLKVEGVGPRGAMKILSGIDRSSFVEALDTEDVEALSSVPGIGKKTAQKVILALRGKLSSPAGGPGKSIEDDIAAALAGMGFDRKVARSAASAAVKSFGAGWAPTKESEGELLKRAIASASEGKA